MPEVKVSSEWDVPCIATIRLHGNEQGLGVTVDKTTGTKSLHVPSPSGDRNIESWDVLFEYMINRAKRRECVEIKEGDRQKEVINITVSYVNGEFLVR